jgi:nitrogen fixation/metabolism regulation signal transduction histidine kinase
MSSKFYNLNIILYVVLLALDTMAFFYALHQEKWYVTSTVTGAFIPLIVYGLVRYANRFRKELGDFLLTIKHKDYSRYQYSNPKPQERTDLYYAFHTIMKEIQNVQIDKEAHYHYLRELVGNIEAGIISYKADGSIHLLNAAARNLLKIPFIRNISELGKYHPALYRKIADMKSGERKLYNLQVKDELLRTAIRVSEFKLKDIYYKLLSFQDIRSELDAQELESWQKLIKVLRHEIMNSITPIASLSEASKESLEDFMSQTGDSNVSTREELEDLNTSLNIIHSRSRGLMRFVDSYRKLTSIPQPRMDPIDLVELLKHAVHLLKPEMKKKGVGWKLNIPESPVPIKGDFDQIQQVIINILLNALEALEGWKNPAIQVSLREITGKGTVVAIEDNGSGIDEKELTKIFVPFYTTKKDGSGIGLSFARQIMKYHNGEISLHSEENIGTKCELIF